VLLQGTEGLLVCDAGRFSVTVLFGALQLPAGGLAASGKVYAQAVSLAAGQSVTW
jgi:hypothetical protein